MRVEYFCFLGTNPLHSARSFKDLEIRAVLLDEVVRESDQAPNPEYILDLEVKSLRDTRELLEKAGLREALGFIEENPHPRLWRLLAEAAVDDLDLATAENAYVRCKDYPGIQFVKRLQSVQNEAVKKAEVGLCYTFMGDGKIFVAGLLLSLVLRSKTR